MAAKKRAVAKKKGAAKKAVKAKPTRAAKPATPKRIATTSASPFATPEGGPWGKCFLPRQAGERRFWLAKSEPEVFSWDDLQRAPGRTTCWNGVRNFAARNFMRDAMRIGDLVFYYHSNAEPPAVVGVCEVVREGYPDATAFDRADDGYDEGSSVDAPTWYMVDLRAVEALATPVTLPMIKGAPSLSSMALLRVGRLSVSPVSPAEWETIMAMSRA